MERSILLVGCGNMGFAMLKGWLAEGGNLKVSVIEPNKDLRSWAAKEGADVYVSIENLKSDFSPELIVMAVKPQIMEDVLPAYRTWANGSVTFLSVAAGINVDTFLEVLGRETPVIRCMPNTPSAIGKGMLVCWANRNVIPSAINLSSTLLSSSGEVLWVDEEELMDAVTAVSGSGPAYLFHFIESMAVAGIRAGLPKDVAEKLALQTVYGAASLARYSENTPESLRQQVTSPGGTTAAALQVLMENERLVSLVNEAVASAKERSIELGKK